MDGGYGYAKDDPINENDPSGLCTDDPESSAQEAGYAPSDCVPQAPVGKPGEDNEPEFGRKLDYVFGKATGSQHNIDRSRGMLKELRYIGIYDNAEGRVTVEDIPRNDYYSPGSIVRGEVNGTVERESLLMGPHGGVKLISLWRGSRLISVVVKAAKK